MIALVNFANGSFKMQQRWNSKSAVWFGGIQKVFEYSPNDIDQNFIDQNKTLFKHKKGFGNYFWKPYIIQKALNQLNENDYLVYADSGTFFLKNVKHIIKYMEAMEKNMICFKLPLIEKQWTKRDAFLLMECDEKTYTDSRQITGNFIVFKKNKKSEHFIENYLKYCADDRVISDDPNTLGKPNYPEFLAHRHDQSVLSLLCKKDKVLLEGDLSDYGYFPYKYIHKDTYIYDKGALDISKNKFKGSILANRKVHPLKYALKYFVRLFLLKLGFKL